MKICVVGAGAIGGFIGTRLALTVRTTSARWPAARRCAALREHGWRLRQGGALLRRAGARAQHAAPTRRAQTWW